MTDTPKEVLLEELSITDKENEERHNLCLQPRFLIAECSVWVSLIVEIRFIPAHVGWLKAVIYYIQDSHHSELNHTELFVRKL